MNATDHKIEKTMRDTSSSQAGDGKARVDEQSFRPAVARLFFDARTRQSGRFDLTSLPVKRSSDMSRALMTGLLVLYPAFATAGVIIASFLLAGATA